MKISLTSNRCKSVLISILFVLLENSAFSSPVIVVGHKNPDSDSIFAAISLAYLKSQQGIPAIATAQAKPNPESEFVLNYFNLQTPAVITTVAGNKVALVDHNTYAQAPDDIKEADIVEIIDHHNLGGLLTDEPIDVLIEPVGSTNTIIWQLYQRSGIAIPSDIAGGMLSAILSDTLVFKSPTTTSLDRTAAESLATIAKIKDIHAYGQKMFLAGEADLKSEMIENLLHRDFKNFNMNGNKVGVAQLQAVSFELLKQRKDSYLTALQSLQKEKNYKAIILMLTDIQSESTEILIIGDDEQKIAKAFGFNLTNHSAWVPGLMSRKKQIIPVLTKVYSQQSHPLK